LPDVELHATEVGLQPRSLAPARLLELMGRRGGWTMDALIESSGCLAREVAAMLTWLELDGKVPEPLWSIRAGVNRVAVDWRQGVGLCTVRPCRAESRPVC
jgi:hypothetical protein